VTDAAKSTRYRLETFGGLALTGSDDETVLGTHGHHRRRLALLAVLAAAGQIPLQPPESLFLGELSLDGGLRRTAGILPMVALARDRHLTTVFVPAPDARDECPAVPERLPRLRVAIGSSAKKDELDEYLEIAGSPTWST